MKVNNTQPNIQWIMLTGAPDIQLLPGINFVDDKHWEKAKATLLGVRDPKTGEKKSIGVVDALLEGGKIEIVHPAPGKGEPGDGTPSLEGHDEGEAIRLARNVFDLGALNRLLERETRPRVKDAIQAQIDEINRPPTDDEKKAREGRADTSPRIEEDPDGDDEDNARIVMPKPAQHVSAQHKVQAPLKKK